MFCKNCGSQIGENDNFCENCGSARQKDTIPPTQQNVFKDVFGDNETVSQVAATSEDKPFWKKRFHEYTAADKKKFSAFVAISVAVIIAAMVIAIMTSNLGSSNTNTTSLTYSNYQKIEIGMSYSQVCNSLGRQGKLTADSYIDGIGSYQCYEWSQSSPKIVVINVWFAGGKVDSKYQAGL